VSRISTIVSEAERNQHVDDHKNFSNKFSFLLALIVFLSAYIIFQGFNTLDELSTTSYTNKSLSLEMVEREINGNTINLAVIEDDFSELAPIDLRGINLMESSVEPTVTKTVTAPVSTTNHKVTVQNKKVIKHTPKKVLITSQDGSSLSFIKKKFYATNNAIFSMKLAEKFYASKKYEKALKWSLITNEIDSKNEKSWLMFAEIKDKMGRKQDAINALNQYLKYENSSKAKQLLKKIKKSV
jgi:tetratricopeptide (TPR) repeat protein